MADWSILGREPTAESDLEDLRACARSLDEFLDGHPEADDEIMNLISRRFDGEIGPQTAALVYGALSDYLGEDRAFVLAWVATTTAPEPRIDALGETLPEGAEAIMRRVAAAYAPEFLNAWEVWNEMPHAWRNFYREVYFDALNSRPYIRIRIVKMNGETVMVEGAASSILQLATNMLITIGFIRNVGSTDVFRPEIVEGFLTEADTVLEFLRSKEEVPAEGAESRSG